MNNAMMDRKLSSVEGVVANPPQGGILGALNVCGWAATGLAITQPDGFARLRSVNKVPKVEHSMRLHISGQRVHPEINVFRDLEGKTAVFREPSDGVVRGTPLRATAGC
jgi:hypothetical protein